MRNFLIKNRHICLLKRLQTLHTTCLDPDPDSQSGSASADRPESGSGSETMYKILLSNSFLFSHLCSLEKDRKYLEADLAPTTKEKHRRAAVVENSLSISERILLDSVKVSGKCTKN